ncbi:hypothetical protein MYU51_019907 [Penicillium brevicompactum]|uniref:uncharacterized protein n=1 Tax=Penicillium brevicompactum TaxID=5074 RepID=UPI0025419915|nr:uncharacterized protein N7506_000337 [Penicillium brevicompactum]KAJ5347084.1 hypothetical protein N7506_000337 [Penicillium brevicompactum]
MERPSQNIHPAATSIKLPTLRLAPSLKRSTTYSTPCEENAIQPDSENSTAAMDTQLRDYHYQVKATLTNILNDERVKHNPNGSRCVQEILLENEHDMRRQRRESLSSCTAKRTMLL